MLDTERHLAVRDFLCTHPDWAAGYATLKLEQAVRSPRDIEGYCDGKYSFVKAMEREAPAWYIKKE